jgi:hypothetical protein
MTELTDTKEDHSYAASTNEIARRLAAAYVSYQAGYAGVDYLLKQTPKEEKVGELWKSLAELASDVITETKKFVIIPRAEIKRMGDLLDRSMELFARTLGDDGCWVKCDNWTQWSMDRDQLLRDAGVVEK